MGYRNSVSRGLTTSVSRILRARGRSQDAAYSYGRKVDYQEMNTT